MKRIALTIIALIAITSEVSSFSIPTRNKLVKQCKPLQMSDDDGFKFNYNPLNLKMDELWNANNNDNDLKVKVKSTAATATALTLVSVYAISKASNAAAEIKTTLDTSSFRNTDLNPDNFKPVCANSDTLYRFLQSTAKVVVGDESFTRFGPLIAEGLLRVRLELCVVESFVNEAAVPFIQKNGLTWVLPLHETAETFLAGTIFGLASTFILVGSTKLITVIFTYSDFFLGAPCRLIGGIAYDRARGKPITWDVGIGSWKTRVIGPKDDLNENGNVANKDLDFSNVNPILLPIVLLTGTVKLLGYTSKVCYFHYYTIKTNINIWHCIISF